MTAYVISTIKFVNRDPLSNTTGIQALIEVAAVAASVGLAAIPLVRGRFFPRLSAPTVATGGADARECREWLSEESERDAAEPLRVQAADDRADLRSHRQLRHLHGLQR
jgi:hypothetical protein